MKKKELLFIVLSLLIWSCKDSTTESQSTNNSIVGTWGYSGDVGFVDNFDPENIFFPSFTFNSDISFEETAKYVRLPVKQYIGYKYVKTGSMNIVSDSIIMTIQKEIYLTFADSLQPKPSPVSVSTYVKKYKFIIDSDTLKLAELGVPGLFYINYYKR
ncbi:MAG: hypothetical protein WCT99_09000 [Bacteroidota bacterium]|jgi:hypothetical protein